MDARVALQRRMLAAFEAQERRRKIDDIREVCPDVSEEEAGRALDLCSGREADAAAALAGDASFRRRVCGPGGGRPASGGGGGSRAGIPSNSPVGPRPKKVDMTSLGDGVFIGTFRGGARFKSAVGGGGGAAAAAAPAEEQEEEEEGGEDAAAVDAVADAALAAAAPASAPEVTEAPAADAAVPAAAAAAAPKKKKSRSGARAKASPPAPAAIPHRLVKKLADGTLAPASSEEVVAAAAEAAAAAAAAAAAPSAPPSAAPSASDSDSDSDAPAALGALVSAPLPVATALAARLPPAARAAALDALAASAPDRAVELKAALEKDAASGKRKSEAGGDDGRATKATKRGGAASRPPSAGASRPPSRPSSRPSSRPPSAKLEAGPLAAAEDETTAPPPPAPATAADTLHASRPAGAVTAVTRTGHVNRGRLRQKSSKAAQLVDAGTLHAAPGWHNAGYIFPLGFRSRVSFRSSVALDQLTIYECRVVGQGGAFWPAPTFEVVAADRPDEPLVAKSCTGCWTAVLKRINGEIAARRAAGEDLPPPPKTAIAGPEYFGFCQPEIEGAIEALDPAHAATDYWKGKEDRAAVAAGLPARPGGGATGRRRRARRARRARPRRAAAAPPTRTARAGAAPAGPAAVGVAAGALPPTATTTARMRRPRSSTAGRPCRAPTATAAARATTKARPNPTPPTRSPASSTPSPWNPCTRPPCRPRGTSWGWPRGRRCWRSAGCAHSQRRRCRGSSASC